MPYSDTYGDIYEPSVAFVSDYHYVNVPWGQLTATLHELVPGADYDVSVAAYDHAGRSSGFAADTSFSTPNDTNAPGQPAAPTAVGSPLVVQVSHTLGLNSGGTYNLDRDLDHLNVYIDTVSGFTPGSANKQGAIAVTSGHLILGIPAIGTFPFPDDTLRYVKVTAVDKAGNESTASPQASVTPGLIDTAQIADLAVTNAKINSLSAGKITTGTLTAQTITVGTTGVIESDNYVADTSGWRLTDTTAEFNDILVRGDIESGNWNGASPANLATKDGTATTGFYLDSSVGAAQFEGDVFVGGSIQIDASEEAAALLNIGDSATLSASIATDELVIGLEGSETLVIQNSGNGGSTLASHLTVETNGTVGEGFLVRNTADTQDYFNVYDGVTVVHEQFEIVDGANDRLIFNSASGGGGLRTDQSAVYAPLMEGPDSVTNVTTPNTSGSFVQWGTEEIDIAWPASTPCRVWAFGQGEINEDGGGLRTRMRVTISFDGGTTWDTAHNGVSSFIDPQDPWDSLSHWHIKSGTPTGNIQVRMEYATTGSGVDLLNGSMGCFIFGDI